MKFFKFLICLLFGVSLIVVASVLVTTALVQRTLPHLSSGQLEIRNKHATRLAQLYSGSYGFLYKESMNQTFLNMDWTGLVLKEVSLRYFDLTSIFFKNVRFIGVNLSESQLQGTQWVQSTIQYSSFQEANLKNTSMWQVKLKDTTFFSADLRKAQWVNVHLNGVDMRQADLRDANLSRVKLSSKNRFSQALYNQNTLFPPGFKPSKKGMIKE